MCIFACVAAGQKSHILHKDIEIVVENVWILLELDKWSN